MEFTISAAFPQSRIEERPGRGRCIIADRAISAGCVVLASTAAAVLPLTGERRCDFCVFDAGIQQCSACKCARYCDKAHATASWKAEHRFECKKLAALHRAQPAAANDIVLLSRLWRGTRSVAASDTRPEAHIKADAAAKLYRHSFADVLRMHRSTDASRKAACRAAAAAAAAGGLLDGGSAESIAALQASDASDAASTAIKSDRLPESVAAAVLSAFECNNFLVVDDLFHGRAAGVFPAGALLNHSCAPNATLTYMSEAQYASLAAAGGAEAEAAGGGAGAPATAAASTDVDSQGRLVQVIRALRPIAAGEEVCHSFVEIALPRDRRREQLKAAYGFDCTCDLCAAEAEAEARADAAADVDRGDSGSAADGSPAAAATVAALARRGFESAVDGCPLPSPTLGSPGQPRGGAALMKLPAGASPMEQLSVWLRLGRSLLLETAHALAIAGEHAGSEPMAPAQVRALLSLLQERWAAIETAAAAAAFKPGAGSAGATAASVLAMLPALDSDALRPTEPLSKRVACLLRLSDAATLLQLRGRLDAGRLPAPPEGAIVVVVAADGAAAVGAAGSGGVGSPALPPLDDSEVARRRLQYGAYYASPLFLQHGGAGAAAGESAGGAAGGAGGGLSLAEQRAAASEVEFIETALAVMRSQPPAGPGAAPLHLTVQAAVNALLARYLLLHDVPAAALACEYICAFYAAAFAACGAHPLWGLQLYTLADLLAELHDTARSVAAAAVRARVMEGKGAGAAPPTASSAGFTARSKPIDGAAGGATEAKASLGRHALVTPERWQRLRFLLNPGTQPDGSESAESPPALALASLHIHSVDLGDASQASAMLKSLRSLAASAYTRCAQMLSVTHGEGNEMAASARARALELSA